MIILDTNVISEVLRPQPAAQVVSWMESLPGQVSITAVTLAELLAGIHRLPVGQRRTILEVSLDAALQPYLATRSVLAFDAEAATEYAEVLTLRESAGLPISTADAQIAAICRVHHATCATRNTRDFRSTGIDVVNPWET